MRSPRRRPELEKPDGRNQQPEEPSLQRAMQSAIIGRPQEVSSARPRARPP
jgi:hypothetical protein